MASAQNPLDTCALPWKALKCPTQSFSKIYFENYGKISYFLKKLKKKIIIITNLTWLKKFRVLELKKNSFKRALEK